MPSTVSAIPPLPFPTTEDAWFWAVGSIRARREGQRGGGAVVPRPCEPDDVMLCLERLYRDGKIDLSHARVLRCWGERQMPPHDGDSASPERDHLLWRAAMSSLGPVLKRKGIVGEILSVGKKVVDMPTRA
jgi:hypothetical protein